MSFSLFKRKSDASSTDKPPASVIAASGFNSTDSPINSHPEPILEHDDGDHASSLTSSTQAQGAHAVPVASTAVEGAQPSLQNSNVKVGGYLMKQGHTFKVWKRRFFLFESDRLEYRKSPSTTEVLGLIPLRRFETFTPSPDSKDFEIRTPGRTYYLRAETLQSKLNWIAELNALQKRLLDAPRKPNVAQAAGGKGKEHWQDEQSSVHCGTCKVPFSLTKRKNWCEDCGFAYCNSPKCFNMAIKICTVCSHDTHAMGVASAEGQLVDAAAANLAVHVFEARGIRGADRNGSSDPYAVLYLGGRRLRTKTAQQTLFPWWDESFEFPLEGVSNRSGLQIAIYDEDKYNTHAFLGMVYIPLAALRGDQRVHAWFPLQPRPGGRDDKLQPTGSIRMQLSYSYSPSTVIDYSDEAMAAKQAPELSRRTLTDNVKRFQRIMAGLQIDEWRQSYRELISWQRPFRTLFALLIYCFTVLYFPARLLPALLPCAILFVMSATYVDRRYNGQKFAPAHEPIDGSVWGEPDAELEENIASAVSEALTSPLPAPGGPGVVGLLGNSDKGVPLIGTSTNALTQGRPRGSSVYKSKKSTSVSVLTRGNNSSSSSSGNNGGAYDGGDDDALELDADDLPDLPDTFGEGLLSAIPPSSKASQNNNNSSSSSSSNNHSNNNKEPNHTKLVAEEEVSDSESMEIVEHFHAYPGPCMLSLFYYHLLLPYLLLFIIIHLSFC